MTNPTPIPFNDSKIEAWIFKSFEGFIFGSTMTCREVASLMTMILGVKVERFGLGSVGYPCQWDLQITSPAGREIRVGVDSMSGGGIGISFCHAISGFSAPTELPF
jgi:hypothetical protein